MPRITALLMLRSTMKTVSAPASSSFRGSLPHPTHPLCTLRVRRHRRLTQHSLPGGPLRPYRRIFPGTVIDKAKATETEVQTTKRGYRLATSVGGTLTGRDGDLIIIDDPIKPQDAQSKSVREKTIQWYENTLLSRLDDKVHGAIVVVMQRLHLDDLAGHLLEKRGFEHLCLPAIAEQKQTVQLGNGRTHVREVGDVLDPVREPLSALER